MSSLTAEQIDQILEACRSNVESMAQSLNANFGTKYDLSIGTESNGAEKILEKATDEPGVVVTLEFDDFGIVCLIPESLPIPGWYLAPDESQASRLQTLSMEWSVAMLPPDLEATQFKTVPTGNLRQHLENCQLPEDATMLELVVQSPMGGAPQATFQVVLPVAEIQMEGVPFPSAEKQAEEASAATVAEQAAASRSQTPEQRELIARTRRVRRVPVKMMVRIAERRIDVKQLRVFSPGTLLTFDKPCDSLLDVYVGDQLYCRGEAVKVGENFGVKINECNSQVVRGQKVHKV